MTNYIIEQPEGTAHYFCKKGQGIWYRKRRGRKWTEDELLYAEGADGFAVYGDENGLTHLICTNKRHDTVYFVLKDGQWHKYILSVGRENVAPQEFCLISDHHRLHLFYTAVYNDEAILVHCLLGANAQPVTADKLSPAHIKICVAGGRIYYTNKEEVLGFREFGEGGLSEFSEVAKGGCMPAAVCAEGRVLLAYKYRHKLYFNGEVALEDFTAERPALIYKPDKLLLQWKSGSFARYMASFNMGKTWSAPMRFVCPSKAELYMCPADTEITACYGYHSRDELILFGDPQLAVKDRPPHYRLGEIAKLKEMVEELYGEVEKLKGML